MKRLIKILALLLSLVLLLSVLPCVVASDASKTDAAPALTAPAFSGLVAAAQDRIPGVILLSDPVYYVDSIDSFHGRYASFFDEANNIRGVANCDGQILFQTNDPHVLGLQPFSNGVCMLMYELDNVVLWLPYTVYGQRLGPNDCIVGNFSEQYDWATGEPQYVCGKLRNLDEAAPVGHFLIDGEGHYLAGEAFGLVYNRTLPFPQNGKWGLRDLAGNVLLPYTYSALSYVDAETLLAEQYGAFRLIDRSGATVAELPGYAAAESLAPTAPYVRVQNAEGLWGLCNNAGELIVPCRYQRIPDQTINEAAVCIRAVLDGQWVFVASNGTELPLGAASDSPTVLAISDEYYLIGTYNNGYQVVDPQGTPVLDKRFDRYYTYGGEDWLLLVSRVGESSVYAGAIYDTSMRLLREIETENDPYWIGATSQAVYLQEKDGLCFYSREDGTLLNQLKGAHFVARDERFVIVLKSGRYAMTDPAGNFLTDYWYTNYMDALDGLCLLRADDGWVLLDSRGAEVLTGLSGPIFFHTDGGSPYAAYQVDGKYGFLQYRGADEPMFVDVEAGRWFTEGIDFCALAGLMNGVGGGRFAPQSMTTRAMLVRVLYNLSGSPCASHGFVDVEAGRWYTDAVNWAAANGIVNGVDPTHFSPDAPVTREQLVTILCRYAQKFGETAGAADVLDAFADADQVSNYAKDAMRWAVSAGLITGKTPTTLDPRGQATRAEIATVLMRFVKYMAAEE